MSSQQPPAWTTAWSAEVVDGEWVVPFQNLEWAHRARAQMIRDDPGLRLEVTGTNRRAFVKESK